MSQPLPSLATLRKSQNLLVVVLESAEVLEPRVVVKI
jgi:hypothetical protein